MTTPVTKSDVVKQIIRGITKDVKQYDLLHQTLIQQQRSYIAFDPELLQETTAKLEPMLNELSHNAQLRSRCLHYLGLPDDKSGMQRFIQALPATIKTQTAQHWQTLEARIQSCQQQNQLNGQLSASVQDMLVQFTHNTDSQYASAKLMEL